MRVSAFGCCMYAAGGFSGASIEGGCLASCLNCEGRGLVVSLFFDKAGAYPWLAIVFGDRANHCDQSFMDE